MFRRNSVTDEVEYQEKYRYELWWKPLTEEARNDINNAAIREGIKVWPQDMERFLISERIEQYDPVRRWLSALPRWDGRDRLGELADRVKTKTPGWRDNFRVWMRLIVSQWRAGTDTMPVWRVTLVTPVSPYKTGCTPSVYRGCVTLTP